MKVLLDTHAVAWYALGDSKLSATALTVIADPSNQILVSPASYWEIAIKVHTGKWRLTVAYSDFLDIVFVQYGFTILPISPEHAAKIIGLPDHHRDPFDRLLVAQAQVENIPLVSADAVFDQYAITRIWN